MSTCFAETYVANIYSGDCVGCWQSAACITQLPARSVVMMIKLQVVGDRSVLQIPTSSLSPADMHDGRVCVMSLLDSGPFSDRSQMMASNNHVVQKGLHITNPDNGGPVNI